MTNLHLVNICKLPRTFWWFQSAVATLPFVLQPGQRYELPYNVASIYVLDIGHTTDWTQVNPEWID